MTGYDERRGHSLNAMWNKAAIFEITHHISFCPSENSVSNEQAHNNAILLMFAQILFSVNIFPS